jgi:hypothetical protein
MQPIPRKDTPVVFYIDGKCIQQQNSCGKFSDIFFKAQYIEELDIIITAGMDVRN